jgi:hypothetical protein
MAVASMGTADCRRAKPDWRRPVGHWEYNRHRKPSRTDQISEWFDAEPKHKYSHDAADERVLFGIYERAVEAAQIEEQIEAKFNRLANEWSESVAHVSSLDAMVNHPKYREIIDLGWDAVPFLLKDLERNRRFWLPALAEITTIRPYDPSDAGNSRRMIDAWVKWGGRSSD